MKFPLLLLSLICVTIAAPADESLHQAAPQEELLFDFHHVAEGIVHFIHRIVNKVVDDAEAKLPGLHHAVEEFERAMKNLGVAGMTEKLFFKAVAGFTKALYAVRERLVQNPSLEHLVKWLDEKVKSLCFLISLHGQDCGYPDVDTVGAW